MRLITYKAVSRAFKFIFHDRSYARYAFCYRCVLIGNEIFEETPYHVFDIYAAEY